MFWAASHKPGKCELHKRCRQEHALRTIFDMDFGSELLPEKKISCDRYQKAKRKLLSINLTQELEINLTSAILLDELIRKQQKPVFWFHSRNCPANHPEDDENINTMKRSPSLRMVLVALVVSLGGSFHFGYQLVITNPSQGAFIRFLNNTLGPKLDIESESTLDNVWSFVVAVIFLGALAGSFSIRLVADKVGRKRGLYVSIGIGAISAALSAASKFIPSFILYGISRVTMGYSVSLSLGLAALFLSEARYLIYISEIVMMLAFVVFLPILPETPGYLVQRGAHESAKKSLMFYYKCSEGVAEQHLLNIKEEQKRHTKIFTMTDIMKKGSLRKKAMIGVVVTFAMSFSGVSVINAYAVEILRGTGLTSLEASLANVGIAFVSMVAIVASSMVVDKFGRRPLLLVAFTGCLICNLLVFALMFTFDKYGYNVLGFILIFVICVFIIFFAIGPGPLCYFINAELVGQAARSGAQSWASVVQMLSRFVIVTIFLPMRDSIGDSWSYLILFVAPVIASIIFLYFHLPETKNKSPIEVEEAIAKLPTIFAIRSRRKVVDEKTLKL
ncbi:transporter, major facilitator family protein [Ancylostoma ceylanicum]|uniref:Transporter, major facilitator family protein n=1 Tax=Ancylostoma ceylanicum TaxID=53326 RepID=A0A0D6MAW7_9BILA|nr:transporter, major facilitator family protein [Ancylostoma ceylanicum]